MDTDQQRKCRKCEALFSPRPWQIAKSDFTCQPCANLRDRAAKLRYVRKVGRPKLSAEQKAREDASPAAKARRAAYQSARYKADPSFRAKVRARAQARKAASLGKLPRLPCEVCGAERVEAHHDDYSRPLDVRWLCTAHHREHHRRLAALVAA